MRKIKDLNKLSIEGMEPWRGYLSDKKIRLLDKSWAGTFRNSILPVLPVKTLARIILKIRADQRKTF
jgi:hypothetical protein